MKREVLYTCNVTVDIENVDEQGVRINATLQTMLKILNALKIKGVLFIDTMLMHRLQQSHNEVLTEIKTTLKKYITRGHSVEVLINSDWENTNHLHQIQPERLLDIFANGKLFLSELYGSDIRRESRTIRVLSGKIQPFSYLHDMYTVMGASVDASIIPKLRHSVYFNFNNVKPGEIIRFSEDPNASDRFGKYLGIPRGIFMCRTGLYVSNQRRLKKIKKTDKHHTWSFLKQDNNIPDLVSIKFLKHKIKTKILSPDVFDPEIFNKIMLQQHTATKQVCVLESNLTDVNDLTKENLDRLKNHSQFEFTTLPKLMKKHLTSHNKIRFK